jgi:hypothetical protein
MREKRFLDWVYYVLLTGSAAILMINLFLIWQNIQLEVKIISLITILLGKTG